MVMILSSLRLTSKQEVVAVRMVTHNLHIPAWITSVSWLRVLRHAVLGMLSGVVLLILLVLMIGGGFAVSYVRQVSDGAQLSTSQIVDDIRSGWSQEVLSAEGKTTFLVLGTDATQSRPGEKVLTDTILLMSLELATGQLRAISIPRDLYVPDSQTKINGLYQQGVDAGLDQPEALLESVLTEWTKIPIHHTIILSMDSVAALIDAIGGVSIDVPESFTDERYPRGDVDVTVETDPAVLYETISFAQGTEVMDGQRALKYMRSRKSLSVTQGSDDARVIRQQQVIAAVLKQVAEPTLVQDPEMIGRLYGWYIQAIDQYFSVSSAVALARRVGPSILAIDFAPTSLSVASTTTPGVIFHPREDRVRGWIYLVSEPSEFQAFVRAALGFATEPEVDVSAPSALLQ